ncbi:forkhead box protein L2-like [Dendronephthya gigantea]|uniref:forkhead box protein L2-like n=1 Tax=Dendronephthya gigantea TaxID=151771 RepID=UPI00106DC6C7|nr:forkhead box protein L2-like [Dendronephthya gigantea]XP_028402993.1 forkhead box protein L2-like [Dendronephthya gigantea]
MYSSIQTYDSSTSKAAYKSVNEMDSFGKRKCWQTSQRFSPYGVPRYPTTYSSLKDNQDVLKTFQDSYERLRTDADDKVLSQKCGNALSGAEKPPLGRDPADANEDASDSRDNNSLSYIGMIATAILRSAETKLTLAGIYTYMEKHFYGILSNRPGWRNTVRHNLSLHECFVKGEIAAEGKGRFWRIHPNYFEQFKCGKFNKNILQNSVPIFYRAFGNYRIPTPREDLPLPPFYSGSTWAPTLYPFMSSSYPYPALPYPQTTQSQQRVHAFRTCSSDCCSSCPSVRPLSAIHCSSYRPTINPQSSPGIANPLRCSVNNNNNNIH